jgi:hypothetical protein
MFKQSLLDSLIELTSNENNFDEEVIIGLLEIIGVKTNMNKVTEKRELGLFANYKYCSNLGMGIIDINNFAIMWEILYGIKNFESKKYQKLDYIDSILLNFVTHDSIRHWIENDMFDQYFEEDIIHFFSPYDFRVQKYLEFLLNYKENNFKYGMEGYQTILQNIVSDAFYTNKNEDYIYVPIHELQSQIMEEEYDESEYDIEDCDSEEEGYIKDIYFSPYAFKDLLIDKINTLDIVINLYSLRYTNTEMKISNEEHKNLLRRFNIKSIPDTQYFKFSNLLA